MSFFIFTFVNCFFLLRYFKYVLCTSLLFFFLFTVLPFYVFCTCSYHLLFKFLHFSRSLFFSSFPLFFPLHMRAAAAFVVSSRTADRPHGPCHVLAPLSSTETDEGKGQGGGARAVLRATATEAPSAPVGALQPRRRARRGPASTSVRGRWQAGQGGVARRGGSRLRLPIRDDVTNALRILDFPIAEQAIEVPKFSALRVHRALLFLSRSQRNSWWKCRPCCPEQSSTATSSSLANAFLSGLWSRSLIFLFTNRRHFFFWWWPWTGVFLLCWSCR